MTIYQKLVIGGIGTTIALVLLLWIAFPRTTTTPPSGQVASGKTIGGLTVSEEGYDFGSISMAKGKVSHAFSVKNTADGPIVIAKLSTSCMCTTATLTVDGTRKGPFGMPGHGIIPKINQSIGPGKEAEVEVVFDPAAHGPSGVGRIDRLVYLESESGSKFEIGISATVTP